MAEIPNRPKIYHITHVQNLHGILDAGVLWSDAKRMELGLDPELVGMSRIKLRRLHEIAVDCHPGTTVGQYVPFYFCPRSVMLYILHKGNHPDVTYRGGQQPIVHLQADLRQVVEWAEKHNRRWAFTAQNAGTRYVDCYRDLGEISRVNWIAVRSNDFRDPIIREGKQAEFLLFESFPWELVERIGVIDQAIRQQVIQELAAAEFRPDVRIERAWYY